VTIKTFKCADTQKLFSGYAVRRWVPIERQALRKLEQLELSERLEDLRVPPGNRLEALRGKRRGQYSIRINDQWRLCFRWSAEGAYDVEIVDYH
jgi:proteic killer suppression protein